MSESGWLSLLPSAFREEVLRRSILLHFSPGQVVFRVGDPVGGMYGLVHGILAINTAPATDTPRLIHLGVPGAWTGEGCFMTRQPRRGEMRALTDTWMMHLPLDAMDKMAARNPELIRFFAICTVLTFDLLVRIIHDLQKPKVDRRIAAVLQRLTWVGPVPIPLTQAELGVMVNASRKQVNATLQRFAADGWITNTYHTITINDAESLRRFASEDD
jgi:CRP-like cAMP-binding protein